MAETSVEIEIRLDEIVRNLKVGRTWKGPSSELAVLEACLEKADALIDDVAMSGEELLARMASEYQVHFEEVRNGTDIDALEQRYVRGHGELGFALVRRELASPRLDALLLQRRNAADDASDRWVAILNLQATEARAYWNKFHELAHRLAEPPQQILPLRRQMVETLDEVDELEQLMDKIAGKIAFHPRLFRPRVESVSTRSLSIANVRSVRAGYAPTASLLAVMNACVGSVSYPCIGFVAGLGKKRHDASGELSLRVVRQTYNTLARQVGLVLIPNMRVPLFSSVHYAFDHGVDASSNEVLSTWTTSSGSSLPGIACRISSCRIGDFVYGVISA